MDQQSSVSLHTRSRLPQRRGVKATRRLKSASSDFTHNNHVIASWFQLAQDTAPDSCALQWLHHRVPRRYLMWRTWLVLWRTAAGHAAWPTRESICRTHHFNQTWDLMIWEFWWDKYCRGLRQAVLLRVLTFALCEFNNAGSYKENGAAPALKDPWCRFTKRIIRDFLW